MSWAGVRLSFTRGPGKPRPQETASAMFAGKAPSQTPDLRDCSAPKMLLRRPPETQGHGDHHLSPSSRSQRTCGTPADALVILQMRIICR